MILIRADANEKTGTGHIMRCCAIADALRQCGQQVCFLTADERGASLLQNRNQACEVLYTDYTRMEEELSLLGRLLEEKKAQFFLVDSYFATRDYLRWIGKHVPVGILDDKVLAGYPVDLLINYNIFADAASYGEAGTQTRYLLGTRYVPLRKEFEGLDYQVREKAQRVLITTGGSDGYNLAARLLRRALAEEAAAGLAYVVVSGIYNPNYEELQELASHHANVQIRSNVADMPQLMRESDIAVSAGGSTMYELSAAGVPVICFSFVDNQERIVKGFVEKGLVCFGGDYLAQGEDMLGEIVCHIGRLAADVGLRRIYSQRLKGLVDARGAARIAQELCKLT